MASLTYGLEIRWRYRSLRGGFERAQPLQLLWEACGDPISDEFTPDEIDARELWTKWIRTLRDPEDYHRALGRPYVPISWFVWAPEGGIERAPFSDPWQEKGSDPEKTFLTYYTTPEMDGTGQEVNWLRLPVQEKRWNQERADKGGFITEASGWTPSPLQQAVDLRIFRAAGLPLS